MATPSTASASALRRRAAAQAAAAAAYAAETRRRVAADNAAQRQAPTSTALATSMLPVDAGSGNGRSVEAQKAGRTGVGLRGHDREVRHVAELQRAVARARQRHSQEPPSALTPPRSSAASEQACAQKEGSGEDDDDDDDDEDDNVLGAETVEMEERERQRPAPRRAGPGGNQGEDRQTQGQAQCRQRHEHEGDPDQEEAEDDPDPDPQVKPRTRGVSTTRLPSGGLAGRRAVLDEGATPAQSLRQAMTAATRSAPSAARRVPTSGMRLRNGSGSAATATATPASASALPQSSPATVFPGCVHDCCPRLPEASGRPRAPGDLVFDAAFESGNLGLAERVSSVEYLLHVRADPESQRHRLW